MPPRRPRKSADSGSSLATPAVGDPWQLQTAKAKFSELFRRALAEGPQWVTRHETESVVVLPAEQYEQLAHRARQPRTLSQFFAESPLVGVDLDLERSRDDVGRDIEF